VSDLAATQFRLAQLLSHRSNPADADAVFGGAPGMIAPRLAVYRGNVFANARKALAAVYPIIEKLVGAEFFDGLAREYMRHSPSREGDLNEYGVAFAAFLHDFPHVGDLPYLSDVARLEWAIHRAHYAGDAQALDPNRLASVAAEAQGRLRWRLHPACTVLESRWPLARIWDVHRDDYVGEPGVSFETMMHRCMVYRPAWRVMVGELDVGAYAFLLAVQEGAMLEQSVERALATDASFDLGAAIAAWIDACVIVDFDTAGG